MIADGKPEEKLLDKNAQDSSLLMQASNEPNLCPSAFNVDQTGPS